MFKKLTCLIIFLNIANLGFAQKNLKFGVAAGINYSTIIDRSDLVKNDTSNYKFGYLIKGIIEYQFNKIFSLRLEPGFENKGAKFNSYSFDYTVNMDYLSLPILLRYTPIHQLSLIAGPKFSYRTSIRGSANVDQTFLNNMFRTKFDLGIEGGLMYNFNKDLSLGLTYYQGFMPVAKYIFIAECGTGIEELYVNDYLHNNFGLQLSYVF